ncbi:fibronectin type III domain-containing protein [Nitrosopumilus cobalaminigenes]|uniref:Fibronectin type III domain-containing protein n=1 Tax=Nitrosopumilus cobalaminigenes TaxID=1470066 RepID=A0A7D5QZF5_9ARCH|nr:fibronectin type III domain-containing protein [Nitrosopumilus cobalaminigenes]QLH03340.1 fibronectin type III domain-containing protein [Nitrosopumilus cobalaminigenes]
MTINKFYFLAISLTIFSFSLIVSHDNFAFAQTPSVPETITDLIAIPGNGEIHLSWSAPDNNGSPIISYKIIRWETGSDVFTTFPNLSTTTTAVATGLKNNVSYSFKVIAINSIGSSNDSNIASAKPLSTAPLTDVPNAITDFIATRGDSKVTMTWTKPNENGSPITSYKITYWQIGTDDFKKKTLEAKATSGQITGLTNDASYAFKINAVNALGQSPDSNVDSATPSKSSIATVPNQVRGVVGIPSNGQVFLSWIEPSDNGAAITSYRVTVNEKDSTVSTTYPNIGDVTKTTILGLKNNVSYQFKVSAVNSIGVGKDSSAISVTPTNKVPIAITNLKASPGNGQVTLTWSVSSTSLEDITGYRVREFQTGSTSFISHSIVGKDTRITIDGLTNGIPYGFRVLGVNAQGVGPESNIVYVTPMSQLSAVGKIPAQIGDLRATTGNNQIKLEWSAPFDNGFPITGYKIIQSKTGSNSFTTIQKYDTVPNAIITGLVNDASYNFKVSAVNSEGTGKESSAVSVIPKSPDAPKFSIPKWVKTNAGWWAEGKISDVEYVQGIEYLINQGIVKIK